MTFGCSGVYRRLSVLCRGHTRACRRLALVICNLDLLRTHVSLLSWRPNRKKRNQWIKRSFNQYLHFFWPTHPWGSGDRSTGSSADLWLGIALASWFWQNFAPSCFSESGSGMDSGHQVSLLTRAGYAVHRHGIGGGGLAFHFSSMSIYDYSTVSCCSR